METSNASGVFSNAAAVNVKACRRSWPAKTEGMTRSPMQSQMELFAAELRIPEVRSSSTRGLVSATRVGISGEIHVIMACRDIDSFAFHSSRSAAELGRVGLASAKKEESRGGRECPRSAGGPSPPPSRLMPKMRMASLKKLSGLMSEPPRPSHPKISAASRKSTVPSSCLPQPRPHPPLGLVTCRCREGRVRRSHQDAGGHQTASP